MTLKLTADTLKGIWAGVTLPWTGEYELDERVFRENLERICAARPHGIYTTGSTGEFYALSRDEFRRMVDIFIETVTPKGIPTQVGCVSTNTRDTLELARFAVDAGADALQVALPFWMELTDREVLHFFEDITKTLPGTPLVHYNIPRAKRFLLGPDYERIRDVAPGLIGVKFTFAGSHFGDLQDAVLRNPGLSFFVSENLLVSGMQIGARGSCSSLVLMNPQTILSMFRLAETEQWEEALQIQSRSLQMIQAVVTLVSERGEGAIDPVADKGFTIAAGFSKGHQRCRPPYIGWSDDTVAAVRDLLQRDFREFVYQGD